MHRWISMTINPHSHLHHVHKDELQHMYAMINRIKVSPVYGMIEHWCSFPKRVGSITMTSLVTRIAYHLGILNDAQVSYLDSERPRIGADHFVQGHILRITSDWSYVMIYRGYTTEVPLPCPRLELYATRKLTLHLETGEPFRPSRRDQAHYSVSGTETGRTGPVTRQQARRRDTNLGVPPQPQEQPPPYPQPLSSTSDSDWWQ